MPPTLNYSYPPSSTDFPLPSDFLTNHSSFRSYLHRMNKTPSPICSCPEKAVQTARHLITEYSPFLKWTTSSTSNSPPTSGPEAPHKYRRHHKFPQKYLPHASRTIKVKSNPVTNPTHRTDQPLIRTLWKYDTMVQTVPNCCKCSVVYLSVKHGL